MFLIFGIRSKDKIVGSRLGRCEVCGATAAQTLVRRTTKFSLFFVPLFPVRAARHFVTCTNCGRSRAAAREELVAA
uniref:zinc-ribbon domain-containing protein n=1 Tax=Paractinoplanes polyasparticus TaxID=2856853 RepID=UPI001C853BDC|nr:zinc-ribbon domain-containing protein [Actinoplanes polyasparticus]